MSQDQIVWMCNLSGFTTTVDLSKPHSIEGSLCNCGGEKFVSESVVTNFQKQIDELNRKYESRGERLLDLHGQALAFKAERDRYRDALEEIGWDRHDLPDPERFKQVAKLALENSK